MTKQRSLIGMELDSTCRTIETSQIDRLHRALYQPNAFSSRRQRDVTSADIEQLPPFLLGNLINLPVIYKVLDLNINNILLSRQSVISHLPLQVGDSITIRTFLRDAYEQQASSNPIGFIILESIGCVESDIAFYCERVIAVRGGFQRGRSS